MFTTKIMMVLVSATVAIGFSSGASAQTTTKTRKTRTTTVAPAPVVAPAEVAPPPAAPPVQYSSSSTNSLEVRHGLTLDGFIDLGASAPSRNWAFAPGDLRRGFYLNDASLILAKDFAHARAFIDLPFTSMASANDNHFDFAQYRAQAYVNYFVNSSMAVKVGQYDSFLGLEANASRDRFFALQGLVRAAVVPITHTGAQFTYMSDSPTRLTLRAQVANSNPLALNNITTSSNGVLADQNLGLGLQARVDQNMWYAGVGFIYNEARIDPSSNYLIDVSGGLNLGQTHLGLEIDSKKTGGVSDSAFTVAALGTFDMTPDLSLGARLEYLKDALLGFVPNIETDTAMTLAVGPSYKLDQNLSVRGDIDFDSLKPKFGDTTNKSFFGINLSVVASL